MFNKFRELARFVADETRDNDKGTNISGKTEEAYKSMLEIYGSQNRLLNMPFNTPETCIHDIPRTVLMIRAMHRALNEKIRQGKKDPLLVEAGCGSGFLVGAALALSDSVNVTAYDDAGEYVKVTKNFLEDMGVSSRATVETRDLLEDPDPRPVDILVAEHLRPGYIDEPCIQIPRSFNVNPHFVIPYAIEPGVYFRHMANKFQMGNTIVLGDKNGPVDFNVQAEVILPPYSKVPIFICSDIHWVSPFLGFPPLSQSAESYPELPYFHRDFRKTTQNHLLQLHLAGSVLNRLGFGFDHSHWRNYVHAPFEITYPLGLDWYPRHPQKPPVTISGPLESKVCWDSLSKYDSKFTPPEHQVFPIVREKNSARLKMLYDMATSPIRSISENIIKKYEFVREG